MCVCRRLERAAGRRRRRRRRHRRRLPRARPQTCLVPKPCNDASVFEYEMVAFGNPPGTFYFMATTGPYAFQQCVAQDPAGFIFMQNCNFEQQQIWTVSASNEIIDTQGTGLCMDACYQPSASPSPPPPPIVTCGCTGGLEQSWTLPDMGAVGIIRSVALDTCWTLATENACEGTCIVLGDCGLPASQFRRNQVANASQSSWFEPVARTGDCVQQNKDQWYLQSWPCDDRGANPQEDWAYNVNSVQEQNH